LEKEELVEKGFGESEITRGKVAESGSPEGAITGSGAERMREKHAEIIETKMAMDSLVEEAIKIWMGLDPLERLKGYLTNDDENVRKAALEKVQSQITRHIDMFSDMLEAAKDVPVDLLRRAAELTAKLREE